MESLGNSRERSVVYIKRPMQLQKVLAILVNNNRLLAIAFDPYFGKPKIDHITFPLLLIASKRVLSAI